MNTRENSGHLKAPEEQWFRLIVENARDFAIFTIDLDRKITCWNSGAEKLLGYTDAEICGQTADVIFTPEDRAIKQPDREMNTALTHGRAEDVRWHLRKDGSRFWGNGLMMLMKENEKVLGFLKILRDQTAERNTQMELEQSRENLQKALAEAEDARARTESAAKTKDHFIAVVSHELRTPLTPVLLALHTLIRDASLSDHAREAIEMIRRNIEIEARFIDDLLDVTRIARGKFDLALEPMNVHDAIVQAVEMVAPDFDLMKQEFSIELAAADDRVDGDHVRLQQVFWNLLKNASKFTPPGGKVHLRSINEDHRIRVEVSDTGRGIAPDVLPDIFEAFHQGDDTISRKYGGLGLGLAISKAAVEMHHGSICASSQGLDRGAVFTVELPLSNSSHRK